MGHFWLTLLQRERKGSSLASAFFSKRLKALSLLPPLEISAWNHDLKPSLELPWLVLGPTC